MPLRSNSELFLIPGLHSLSNLLNSNRSGIRLAKDVLLSSQLDLMELLGLTKSQADHLHSAVAAHVSPAYRTVRRASRMAV